MLNRIKNILSIIRLFTHFVRDTTITKKWFAAAIFGIYILLPYFGECVSFNAPHLSAETSHSNSLIG